MSPAPTCSKPKPDGVTHWQATAPRGMAIDGAGDESRKHFVHLANELQSCISGLVYSRTEADDEKAGIGTASNRIASHNGYGNGNGKVESRSSDFLESTRLYNAAAPLSAWLVAQPRTAEDVSKIIQFCNEHSLSPSIKSGGYSTAGWAIQGDIVIDVQLMNNLQLYSKCHQNGKQNGHTVNGFDSHELYTPPGIHKDKYVLVDIGAGICIRELDIFTAEMGQEHSSTSKGKGRQNGIEIVARGVPYHVPLSAYPVGSTALTIGGFGYLSRAYGLSLDNVVEVEIVLADGRIMVLNESSNGKGKEEADLWWAVRGAAPCFGVVTRVIAKAYPVPSVYAGSLIFPFNPITALSLLRHWRDCLKGIPRELYSNLILSAGPPEGGLRENVIVIQVCYQGTSSTEEIGHNFVQAICSWTGERVLLKDVMQKSFIDQQDGVAQVLKSGNGRRWMVRSDLISTLTDESIYKTVEQFRQMGPNRAVWLFELIGGAIEDDQSTCIGQQQREAKFTVAALQQWLNEDEDEKCVNAAEKWVKEVMAPISTGGPFPCFLERAESRDRCIGSFGKENFEKLVEIKRRIDPTGMFKHTFAQGLVPYM